MTISPDRPPASGTPAPSATVPSPAPTARRDGGSWAAKVDRLQVEARAGVRGTNVAGRRLTGPIQGFGRMWQKTYSITLPAAASPRQVVATWKAHFPDFWPTGNRFAGALSGINPGDIALLDLAMGGGVTLSTGVFVLYADEESFTLMTPEGHMFAGWISFSAAAGAGGTMVQAQVLMRANDPLYELGLALGGHRKEDRFWATTLTRLAVHFGVEGVPVRTDRVLVDRRRQWNHAGNVRHNAMVRSLAQTALHPLRRGPRAARRGPRTGA